MPGTNDQTKLQIYEQIQAMVIKDATDAARRVYAEEASKYGVAKVPLHTHNGLDSDKVNAWDLNHSQASTGSITMATDGQRYRIGLNLKAALSFAPANVRFNGIAVYSLSSFTISSSSVTSGAIYQVNGVRFTVLATISPGTILSTAGPGNALTATSGILTKVSGTGPSTINFSNVSVTNTIRSLVVGDAFVGPSFYQQPESSSSVNIGGPPQVAIQSSSYILVNDSGAGTLTQASVSEGHIISVTFDGSIVARGTIPDLADFGANDKPIEGGDLLVDVTLLSGWSIIGNWQVA